LIEAVGTGAVSLRNCLLHKTQADRGSYRQRDGTDNATPKTFMWLSKNRTRDFRYSPGAARPRYRRTLSRAPSAIKVSNDLLGMTLVFLL